MERTRRPSLSGLEVRALVKELETVLSGSYVSNIYSIGENQLFRMRRGGGEEVSVVLSPRHGAWRTERLTHSVTGEFTTSLRGELLRSKLDSVSQLDLDRVMTFKFTSRDRTLHLILEMMPPGNIILTDEGGRVVRTLREVRSGQRRIARGATYSPPPQSRMSLENVDERSLAESLSRERSVGKALGRGVSLPRKYVDEILARASLSQDDPTPIPESKVGQMAEAARALISSLDSPTPCIVEVEGATELMVVRPARGRVVKEASSMSALADEVLSQLLLEEQPVEGEDEAGQKARELEVTLQRLERQREELGEKAARLRQLAAKVSSEADPEAVGLVLASSGLLAPGLVSELEGGSTASIASRLYDGAKESEAEARKVEEASSEIRSRLTRVVKRSPKQAPVPLARRTKREWYEKFRWFITSEGRLAVGGRDAQSNSLLVKRHLEEGDVVYHADLFGSPFFVLKGGREQTEEETREVAKATVAFSSAWKTGLSAADAYWVNPDQVSATAPSGEYLARGSFMMRGRKNFVTKNPVEVSVGMDAAGRILAGPEEAVMKRSRAHVTLAPHREKASDTAKKVLSELRRLLGEGAAQIDIDEVLRALPSGGGRIVRRRENWALGEG